MAGRRGAEREGGRGREREKEKQELWQHFPVRSVVGRSAEATTDDIKEGCGSQWWAPVCVGCFRGKEDGGTKGNKEKQRWCGGEVQR